MEDKDDVFMTVFMVLLAILGITSGILILTSDLPWWLKYLLLK